MGRAKVGLEGGKQRRETVEEGKEVTEGMGIGEGLAKRN